jgi:phenylacetate-CoA ligase
VPFYRRRFAEMGLMPEHIRSLDDLRLLPFTERSDLHRGYPYDLFAVPLREVVRLHSATDVTGAPTVMGYTKNDLRNWRELVARVLTAGGISKEDVIQISFSYGLLTDAFGFHQGAEEIGASVIPVSAGAVEQQIGIMQDFRTTTLVGTPSYALRIAEALRDRNVPRSSLHLKWAILGTEPWSEVLRDRLQSLLGVSATDNYGVPEAMGPGVAGECEGVKEGMHLNEDHFLCEVIDPDSCEPLPPGEVGELVITTLTKEALPIIWYRTGDLTALTCEPRLADAPSPEGRASSRTDDTFAGERVHLPAADRDGLAFMLRRSPGRAGGWMEPHYQVVLDREAGVDTMEVRVEVPSALFASTTGDVGHLVRTQNEMRTQIEAALGVPVRLRFVEPSSVERAGTQDRRIIDRRATGGHSG